ncbi:MAG: acyl-CoA thioester hydrolase, partial [Humisphaera sp.]|nr:acyl-CoA thioester hydrolase [Humisphaera sp.]
MLASHSHRKNVATGVHAMIAVRRANRRASSNDTGRAISAATRPGRNITSSTVRAYARQHPICFRRTHGIRDVPAALRSIAVPHSGHFSLAAIPRRSYPHAGHSKVGGSSSSVASESTAHYDRATPMPSLPEHTITLRVRYPEVDAMGYLHHSRFLQYFELGRIELLRAAGYSYADMERDGVFFVVVKVECRYKAPARYDEELTLVTRLIKQ